MKFKVGDRVKVIETGRLRTGHIGTIVGMPSNYGGGFIDVEFPGEETVINCAVYLEEDLKLCNVDILKERLGLK